MNIAYLRVSTDDQSIAMQRNALQNCGIEKWVIDEDYSGKSMDRPGFNQLNEILRSGDTLFFYSLSRLGRNTVELLTYVAELEAKGVYFKSYTENIETVTPIGRMILTLMAALAQMERELIVERVNQGLKTARDNGVKFGPKMKLTEEQILYIKTSPLVSVSDLMKRYKVSKSTIMRARRSTAKD